MNIIIDINKRIEWLKKRMDLNESDEGYLRLQMQEVVLESVKKVEDVMNKRNTLSPTEMLAEFEEYSKEVLSTREKASDFLVSAGINDESGKLTEPYKVDEGIELGWWGYQTNLGKNKLKRKHFKPSFVGGGKLTEAEIIYIYNKEHNEK